ncbi:MAG: Abortive infection protein [Acidimicrobiales bacterium]|nr:Abortive infection protein [Acidimicrobiales bacterium]
MAATDLTHQAAEPEPRWGIGDAVVGWVIALVSAALIGSLLLSAFGYSGVRARAANLPLTMVALTTVPLWLGFIGAPFYAARVKGNGLVRDFRTRIAAIDVPLGLVVGALCQVILVPLISIPLLKLSHTPNDKLTAPARELAAKAHDNLGIVLLTLVVVIGAPIAEELFFRGLLLRAVERRLGATWGVVISGVAFGLTHFQALQTPALIAFGMVLAWLVLRTGRLGTSVVAHMAFNAATVIYLLSHR